ncbi:MAG TPA: hypothetical protein VFL66_10445 [Gaiellaceae bacterium]|nr:hypothetical protein [Gaiellaceae bacterium]
MKSSGWSSRGTWACSAVALTALALAPAAASGVVASPQRIDPGSLARILFSVPDAESVAITRVAIGLPPDFRLGDSEVKGGWRTMTSERTVAWEGGRIMPGQFAEFVLHARAPWTTERAVFPVLVSLANGRTMTYQASVDVAKAPAPRDSGARTLAEAALIVAAIAVLLALGGGFLALWLWLRPRPPDPF